MRGMLYTERTSTSSKHLMHYFSFFASWGMQDLSCLTRDWTCTPCSAVWSPNHWSAREVPDSMPSDRPFSPGHLKKKTNQCVKDYGVENFLGLKNCQASFIIVVMFITILHTHTHTQNLRKKNYIDPVYSYVNTRVLVGLLKKAMAPHSSTLAWKIPWAAEPGRLQSMGSIRVGHDWATLLSLFTFMHWRRKWQPTPVFLPGESQGWGSLVGFHLWDCTESDTTEATLQQQQQWDYITSVTEI